MQSTLWQKLSKWQLCRVPRHPELQWETQRRQKLWMCREMSPESPKMFKGDCKFFLTDEGCRRGSQCRWKHAVPEGEKRCYECGSISHFKGDCPVRKGTTSTQSSTTSSPTTGGVAVKKEISGVFEEGGHGSQAFAVSRKGRSRGKGPNFGGGCYRLEGASWGGWKNVERNADWLSFGSRKTWSFERPEAQGIAEGAGDAERWEKAECCQDHQDWDEQPGTSGQWCYSSSQIKGNVWRLQCDGKGDGSLATGKDVQMRMTSGGVLITNDTVDPIVPLGMLMADEALWLCVQVERGRVPLDSSSSRQHRSWSQTRLSGDQQGKCFEAHSRIGDGAWLVGAGSESSGEWCCRS